MSEDLCSALGLTGLEETICKTLEKTPLTLNFLYKFFLILEPKLPILTTGIEDIFRKNLINIIIYNVSFQQLPWLLNFILLILILWYMDVISLGLFFGLIVFSVFFTIISVIIYLYANYYSLEKLIRELKVQFRTNIDNFKKVAL